MPVEFTHVWVTSARHPHLGDAFDLRQRRVEAAARYHTLLADIERMTATSPEANL